jgi:hypothetical protein
MKLQRQPVMAHPPSILIKKNFLPFSSHNKNEFLSAEESDLTLKSFLEQIWEFNGKSEKSKQKGVKLDFKSTDVFQSSLAILHDMFNTNYEIWLNADIYAGPLNNTSTTPVNPTIFLQESKKFPNAVLSTGWTTLWGTDYRNGSYTLEQVTEMINGIKSNQILNKITFPVRAGIACQSIETLTNLYESLNPTNSITFTIWSSENDYVDVDKLREMIFHFGIDKVYVDVPDALSSQLRLNNARSMKPPSFILVAFVTLFAIIVMSNLIKN